MPVISGTLSAGLSQVCSPLLSLTGNSAVISALASQTGHFTIISGICKQSVSLKLLLKTRPAEKAVRAGGIAPRGKRLSSGMAMFSENDLCFSDQFLVPVYKFENSRNFKDCTCA